VKDLGTHWSHAGNWWSDNPGADNLLSKDIHTYEEMVQRAAEACARCDICAAGIIAVVVADIPFGEAGTTNTLRIEQMVGPHEWSSECLKLAHPGHGAMSDVSPS
jgi:hypothetical protein